jgi:hypothetical protein
VLIKDYDLSIQYTPGKGNVVADALSHKTSPPTMNSLIADLDRMDISYCYAGVTEEETINFTLRHTRARVGGTTT